MQTLTLNNGVTMPLLGLGTYSLTGKAGQKAMSEAIEVGYRLFDSAQMYHNEAELGMAINNAIKGGIKREEFFIQTKLLDANSEDSTKKSIEKSLQRLGLDYKILCLSTSPTLNLRRCIRQWNLFINKES